MWVGGIAALVLTLVCAGLWVVFPNFIKNGTPSGTALAPPSTLPDVLPTPTSGPQAIQAIPILQAVPLRNPPPAIGLGEQEVEELAWQFWFKKLLLPVGLLFGVVAAILWWRRKIIFEQIKSWQKNLGTEAIKVSHQHARHTLPTTQRVRLAAMRFHQAGNRIHWGKTVERTARSAGFPHMQFRSRQRQAEYVMVCDSRHYRDQAAWLLRRVYEEWRTTGIDIHYYDFDRHPEMVWPNGRRDRQAIPLARLRHRHPAGRVLLVAEQEVMFYRVIGGLQSWVEELKEWPDHRLAVINDLSRSNQQQLEQHGIRWQRLSQTADATAVLESLGGRMATREKASGHFPASLQTDAHLWDPDPQQRQEVLRRLTQVITDEGLRLLGGMAMYPKLHGNLTFALHRELQTTDDILLSVVRLPWCRAGWLPPWLRDALLNTLSREDYQRLHHFYRQLFCADPNVHPEGQFDLGINRPPARDWKQWVKHAIRVARRGEELSDAIFARVLLSPRWRPRLRLPGNLLQRFFPRELVERVPAFVKVGAVVPVGIVLIWLAWIGLAQLSMVGEWLAQERLAAKWQEHAQQVVTLRYHPKAQSLVEPIAKGLQAVGFQVAWAENSEVKENGITAPLSVGTEIARIAQYNSWGRKYPVFKAEQPVINLATALQTGQVFTEQPPANVQRAGEYPTAITWVPVPKGVEANQAMKPLVEGTSVKALSPPMIKIPGGTFTMGSPTSETGRDADEGPQHEVQVLAFEIGETEVTFAEWDRCADAGVCPQAEDEGWGRGDRPVINVSWKQAQEYIQWLNETLGLSEGQGYRLPSEAEWEYAARAGTQTAYFWVYVVVAERPVKLVEKGPIPTPDPTTNFVPVASALSNVL